MNPPFDSFQSIIRCAKTGPTPGSESNSLNVEVFRFIHPLDFFALLLDCLEFGFELLLKSICSPSVISLARLLSPIFPFLASPPAFSKASITRDPLGNVNTPVFITSPYT